MSVPFYNTDFTVFCETIVPDWKKTDKTIFASLDSVHVWQFDFEDFSKEQQLYLFSLLEKEEQSKAERYRFERDTRHYSITRGLLRHLLMHYLDTPNQVIKLSKGIYGKPVLEKNSLDLHFNVSHTKEKIFFAFCIGNELGIDVEKTKVNHSYQSVINEYFNTEEQNYIGENPYRFCEFWTRKEALLKAFGTGLISNMDIITILDGSRFISGRFPFKANPNTNIYVKTITIKPDHFISLALLDNNKEVLFFKKSLSFFDR